ncbi:MAG: recombinase family protein [Rhizobiaceae bacterium]|nr:recombinase family protein [Rhizobiaceae bacterium]
MAQSVDSETPAKGYALGYIRVSTDRQAKADLSMPDQEAAIRQFARQIGLEVGAIYQDSMSGTRADRPGLMAMLDAVDTAKARPVAIIVHSLSRIFRDAVELGLLVRTWKKKKVNLLSVTQEFGEGEAAELMLGIVALFDQHQSLETAKHVRRTMVQSAREGYWNGATASASFRPWGRFHAWCEADRRASQRGWHSNPRRGALGRRCHPPDPDTHHLCRAARRHCG